MFSDSITIPLIQIQPTIQMFSCFLSCYISSYLSFLEVFSPVCSFTCSLLAGPCANQLLTPRCWWIYLTLIIVVSLQIFSILNADESTGIVVEPPPPTDEEGEVPSVNILILRSCTLVHFLTCKLSTSSDVSHFLGCAPPLSAVVK